MSRRSAIVLGLVAAATLVVPMGVTATSPAAAAWARTSLGTVATDPCVGTYGFASCERPGGMAVNASFALIAQVDGTTVFQRSTDAGSTWSAAAEIAPGQTTNGAAVAQAGDRVAVAYFQSSGNAGAKVRQTTDFGQSWGSTKGFAPPRQVWADVATAVSDDVVVLAASGYDEIPQSRSIAAVRIKVWPDAGSAHMATFSAGGGCGVMGSDPSVAITGNGTIVVAYWEKCNKLVWRRSTDDGATWTAPKVLATGSHTLGTALAAHAGTVVVAYTSGGTTYVKRSGDRGKTWSAARKVGTGATSLRLTYAIGLWRLLSAGSDTVRFRSSTNGTSWAAAQIVDTEASSKTFAIGVGAGTEAMAAYVIRHDTTPKTYEAFSSSFH